MLASADPSRALPHRENKTLPQQNTNRGLNFQGLWKMRRSFSHKPDLVGPGWLLPAARLLLTMSTEPSSREAAATGRPRVPAGRPFVPPRPRRYSSGTALGAPPQPPSLPGPEASSSPPDAGAGSGGLGQGCSQSEGSSLQASCLFVASEKRPCRLASCCWSPAQSSVSWPGTCAGRMELGLQSA